MRILLTNDDGILSIGLAAMAGVLRRFGEVCIAAPATEQSGVGQGITFLNPLTVKKAYRRGKFWGFAVEGTPVDCVKIGIAELAGWRPDLVVSGINNGLNVGINVLYSGTVAAVQESAWQGIPSVAVSTQFSDLRPGAPIDRVAELAGVLIGRLLEHPCEPGTLYNVNIPFAALKDDANRTPAIVPIDVTPHWGSYEKRHDPIARPYYWLSDRPNPNPSEPTGASTDYDAVASGRVAVTPMRVNPTCGALLNEMKSWDLAPKEGFRFSEEIDPRQLDFRFIRWIDRTADDLRTAR
jgi:5'-nucleotidase